MVMLCYGNVINTYSMKHCETCLRIKIIKYVDIFGCSYSKTVTESMEAQRIEGR